MKRQNAETDRAFRILDICNELLNWILMIILVVLFCYGTYGIGDSYMLEENAMPEHYEIYRPTEEDYGNFDELKAQNSDVCGWITIYGTHVDYPIVQSEDNSTYLMRNPRGEYSLSGSIFMDYMNQKDFSDFNTIIYGHHMDGGAMFGDFDQYLEYDSTDSDWNGQGYGKLSFFSNYDRSGTTYYLKVRSFKLNGTTKIYGPWSSIKTVSVGNYRVASSAKAKYSYKFYFLDTAGIGLYGGVSKAVYIQTDNPDPNSIQLLSNGKTVLINLSNLGGGQYYDDIEYLNADD